MNDTLSYDQREELRRSFAQGGFSLEAAMARLVSEGMDENTAASLITAEYKAYRKELFLKTDRQHQSEEAKKIVAGIVFAISVIGPIFEITSMIWYIIAIAVAGGIGYWGYRPRPIAGLVAAIMVPIVFPLAYSFYFTGRTSYINIEMLIPMAIAVAPAIIVYYLISKTVYANTED